ncbi:MAG: hypothetical protein Q9181_003563 [Wetmoreana brouardii]
MSCNPLKRKAEHEILSDKPCKAINLKGRRIVVDSEDEAPIAPKRKRGDENEPPSKKQKTVIDDRPEQTEGTTSKPVRAKEQRPSSRPEKPTTWPSAKGQQPARNPQGVSFFSLMQRKGAKPIPPQDIHITTVKEPTKPTPGPIVQPPRPKTQVAKAQDASRPGKAQALKPKTAAAKPQDGSAHTTIRPWKVKKPGTKAQEVPGPQTENPAEVPKRKSTPPTANSASALTAVGATEPQGKAKDISPAKRKAEENTEAPAKKAKIESLPPAATPSSAVGAVAGTKSKESDAVASTNLPQKRKAEEISGAPAKKQCQPVTKSFWKNPEYAPDCIVRKEYDTGKRKTSGDRAKTGRVSKKISSPKHGKASSAETKLPAGLKNGGLRCFANVVVQALDGVPELRDHVISKFREADKSHTSLRVCLGRSFSQLETAAKEGKTESLHDFLQAFGTYYPAYNGSEQQEVYDFLEKLLQQLGVEEVDCGEVGAQEIPFTKKLFAGKTVTRLECRACGNKHDGPEVNAYSLQLRVPAPIRGQEATLPTCLEQYFREETPTGYTCEKCGEKDTTSKRDVVKEWGQYLVLNCDRAWQGEKVGTKLALPKHVALEKHMADYKPLAADATESQKTLRRAFPPHNFEVIAFAEHQGTRCNAGHYTATRKVGSAFYLCDDEKVSRRDKDKDFKATTATVVLLRRKDSS